MPLVPVLVLLGVLPLAWVLVPDAVVALPEPVSVDDPVPVVEDGGAVAVVVSVAVCEPLPLPLDGEEDPDEGGVVVVAEEALPEMGGTPEVMDVEVPVKLVGRETDVPTALHAVMSVSWPFCLSLAVQFEVMQSTAPGKNCAEWQAHCRFKLSPHPIAS